MSQSIKIIPVTTWLNSKLLCDEVIHQSKSNKIGLKWWFRCESSNDYLYESNLYLGQKKNAEVNLDESVVLKLSQKLKGKYCIFYLDN